MSGSTLTAASGLILPPEGTVLTVGTFDGVHRGHHDVLTRLVERAAQRGLPSVVITFEPHPLEVVNPAAAPPLLTLQQEKLELLVQVGVSYVVVLPFTPALAAFEAEYFVDHVLRERFAMTELLVGHDHGFGRGRLGDSGVLRALGAARGFGVMVRGSAQRSSGRLLPMAISTGRRPGSRGPTASRAGWCEGISAGASSVFPLSTCPHSPRASCSHRTAYMLCGCSCGKACSGAC